LFSFDHKRCSSPDIIAALREVMRWEGREEENGRGSRGEKGESG